MSTTNDVLGLLLRGTSCDHTAVLINGVIGDGPVAVVVGNVADMQRVKLSIMGVIAQLNKSGIRPSGSIYVVSVDNLGEHIKGVSNCAVAFDVSAVELLLRRGNADLRKANEDFLELSRQGERPMDVMTQLVRREWHMNDTVLKLAHHGVDVSESGLIASQLCLLFDLIPLPKDDPRRESLTALYANRFGKHTTLPTEAEAAAFVEEIINVRP